MKTLFGVDVDKELLGVNGLASLAANILKTSKNGPLKAMMLETIDQCRDEGQRKGCMMQLCSYCLIFKEKLCWMVLIDELPCAPTPVIVLRGCGPNKNPLQAEWVSVHVDREEVVEDQNGSMDITYAVSCFLAVHFVYSLEYCKYIKKYSAFHGEFSVTYLGNQKFQHLVFVFLKDSAFKIENVFKTSLSR